MVEVFSPVLYYYLYDEYKLGTGNLPTWNRKSTTDFSIWMKRKYSIDYEGSCVLRFDNEEDYISFLLRVDHE
jgi:hypothetical protein